MLRRLREIREAQALSQRALAAKAAVTQATIVRAERGEDIYPSTHRKLADALGVDPRELVGERS